MRNQILASDKKNFVIPPAAVEPREFTADFRMVTMRTLTVRAGGRKRKFMFTHSFWKKDESQVAYAEDLWMKALSGRLEFKRIRRSACKAL